MPALENARSSRRSEAGTDNVAPNSVNESTSAAASTTTSATVSSPRRAGSPRIAAAAAARLAVAQHNDAASQQTSSAANSHARSPSPNRVRSPRSTSAHKHHHHNAAPEPLAPPRLIMTSMVLENFKSYAGRQEIGPFHKCFSSIVGVSLQSDAMMTINSLVCCIKTLN
jgi:hypothetical protein